MKNIMEKTIKFYLCDTYGVKIAKKYRIGLYGNYNLKDEFLYSAKCKKQ